MGLPWSRAPPADVAHESVHDRRPAAHSTAGRFRRDHARALWPSLRSTCSCTSLTSTADGVGGPWLTTFSENAMAVAEAAKTLRAANAGMASQRRQ